jgi:Zn-dependent protease with chaperone function
MSTNFFKQQGEARRKTFWLLVQFGLAVVCLMALTYCLVVVCLIMMSTNKPDDRPPFFQLDLFLTVVAVMGAVVAGGSMLRVAQLSQGGKSIALMLGGRQIATNTRDLHERRILNIVEEMAIASGVAVPTVYLLPQEGSINAFAAGRGQGDAVVAVSQGCIDYLTRDELQGVVAHEFSHILNGDMALDLRMLALISGIMGLAEAGRLVIWLASNSSSRSSSDDDKKDNRTAFLLLGVGLLVLGLIGAFLGSLIKAAISRQREFLADASALQFTRNPNGIGGALKKIGGASDGSRVKSNRADEVSNIFLASPLSGVSLLSMFATHPPLEERIRAIDPYWDGKFPEVRKVSVDPAEEAGPRVGPNALLKNLPSLPGMPQLPLPVVLAGLDSGIPSGSGGAGEPRPAKPAESGVLGQAAREPFSAPALVYCMLLDRRPEHRQAQLNLLREAVEPAAFAEVQRLIPIVDAVPESARLPLLDRLQPALLRMSVPQYRRFRTAVDNLIAEDGQVALFEYALRSVVIHRLDLGLGLRKRPSAKYSNPRSLLPALTQLLSHLAWEGNRDPREAQLAFAAGMRTFLGKEPGVQLLPREQVSLREFHAAVLHCALAMPNLKRQVLAACGATVLADGKITVAESELVRAVGALLECPLPQQLEATPVQS